MLQIVLLSLGVILLCTAHLMVGFFVGYRLMPQRNQTSGGRESVPAYFPTVLELIERSQQLHLQTSAFAQELPGKFVQAVALLMESAESLHCQVPTNASLVLASGQSSSGGKRSQSPSRKPFQRPVSKPPSSVDIPTAPGQTLDYTTKLATVHSQVYPPHAFESEDQLDDSRLAMTDMMSLVVKANRESRSTTGSDVRYPYPTRQFVAFSSAGELPPPEEFESVQCLDVSSAGISFLLGQSPPSETLVISLGQAPQLRFMAAKIVNHRYMLADGIEGYRVGCKFLKRIDTGTYDWDPATGKITDAGDSATQVCCTDLASDTVH